MDEVRRSMCGLFQVNILILVPLFSIPLSSADDFDSVAEFGVSQRRATTLIYRGQTYVKDRAFNETTNWRCALFRRRKCRARAITRLRHGQEMVKATHPFHTHNADGDI